ncbi:MAG TPA: hypothetical protein DCQ29_13265 [Chitinophagaceae bacterium]|nr:hypothetical protein [Chitinophagaceae bacterium]
MFEKNGNDLLTYIHDYQMKKILYLLVAAVTITACSKKSDSTGGGTTPIPPIPPVTTLLQLPAGWKLSSTLGLTFPTGIQVYQFDTTYMGRTTKAFCVAFDSRNTNLEFKPVMAATATTPTAFYNAEPGVVYACINGGFFSGNQSFSTVKYNNTVSAPNVKALTRTFNGNNTSYFPTRAAFGVNSTGAPSAAWIYHVGTGNDLIYSYPIPSPNALNVAPQAIPTANFPAGGTIWNTTSAIGGSPMLVYDNAIRITDSEELISVNNTTDRPRSAIGHTSNGIIVLLAVEGDNSPTYPGINLNNLANMLKDLGCTYAINLDGGGSTSMVVGGTRTVRPGDGGNERGVISAVIIKRK